MSDARTPVYEVTIHYSEWFGPARNAEETTRVPNHAAAMKLIRAARLDATAESADLDLYHRKTGDHIGSMHYLFARNRE